MYRKLVGMLVIVSALSVGCVQEEQGDSADSSSMNSKGVWLGFCRPVDADPYTREILIFNADNSYSFSLMKYSDSNCIADSVEVAGKTETGTYTEGATIKDTKGLDAKQLDLNENGSGLLSQTIFRVDHDRFYFGDPTISDAAGRSVQIMSIRWYTKVESW